MRLLPLLIRVARTPIVQFFAAGGILFLVYRPKSDEARIVLTDERYNELIAAELRSGRTAPNEEERREIVTRYLESELFFRESIRLGMAGDDPQVKKRLADLARAVARGATSVEVPSEEELKRQFDAHWDRYSAPPKVRLDYIFFSSNQHEHPETELKALREDLLRDPKKPIAALGEQAPLARDAPWVTHAELTRILGKEVADAAFRVAVASWSEPVAGAHGYFLLRAREVDVLVAPSFETVRDQVMADVVRERGRARERSWVKSAAKRYTIELPHGVRYGFEP